MQNKFQNLQNKFQSTVQGLNSNITDGATRLRQQLSSQTFPSVGQEASGGGGTGDKVERGAAAGGQTISVPVDSARQLRWYDNADLKILLKLHLKEKHELYMANAALREALQKSNRGTHMGVTRINSDIDKMVAKDAALSEFMVLAAGYEIDSLRKENELLKKGMGGGENPVPSDGEDGNSDANETESLVHIAQKAQYEAEMGRASAEEKLEKFQHMSSTQQAEIESLKGQQTAHVNEIAKMQSKIHALEKELSLSQKSSQQAASKSHEELSAKVSHLFKQNRSLNDTIAVEVAKNRKFDKKLQANEIALSKALAEVAEMGSILSDRDELQARVLYYESLLADMRCIDRKDSSVQDRLEEALEKLKTTQEELVLTAKTAASLEAELSTAVRAIEESEVRREKMRVELETLQSRINASEDSHVDQMASEELEMAEIRLKNLHLSNQTNEKKLIAYEKECRGLQMKLEHAETQLNDLHMAHEKLKEYSQVQVDRLEAALLASTQSVEDLTLKNRALKRAVEHSQGTPTRAVMQDTKIEDTDTIYRKNIVMKYIECCLKGKLQECEVLLPAVKTVLHASTMEFNAMRQQLEEAQSLFYWIPSMK
eukprot:CAMPEP_0118803560 /NCGR_PEP_ID=MMETSP1161-20130426/17859_1 /TAXON_ID=249345 /ORGANISM="Picochlorum oklahomensis, Strain CCMP2329" /LENGTH=600 /DNA_ID=CAMNT_0006732095 /DNA_START=70 /DNA_END=1872 /DNA_ORIENTATION=-